MSIFVPGKPGGSPRGRGRIQRAIARAYLLSDAQPITAGHVRRYAFPRCSSHERSHYRSIRLAFESIGCRVVGGREAGRAIVWAPPGKA
jgi:hypothetical protein